MAPAVEAQAGTRVWIKEESSGKWLKGLVEGQDGELLLVSTANGQHRVPVSAAPLQNSDDEPVDDMTDLAFLHEPGVLWNLKQRYSSNAIYTYTGSILIAVNPFKALPQLYGKNVMDAYSGGDLGRLPPHVYAIASAAYKRMRSEGKGQAILVTGESGAGKTETSKLIMRYLAYLGGFKQSTWDLAAAAAEAEGAAAAAEAHSGSSSSIEHKVLESNPLLEAFGNAKTVRNDNSSRFGKYVEINFNARGAISGAAIRTYLLERSRLVHLNSGERNYHIFYQLCDGASPEERSAWLLQPASSYTYLNQSDVYTLPGVDNAQEFAHTRAAMSAIGLSASQQDEVFRMLSALLHLGNIAWQDTHGDTSSSNGSSSDSGLCNGTAEAAAAAAAAGGCPLAPGPQAPAALAAAATLMGCDVGALARALSTRTRATPDGPITSPLDAAAAASNRDALVKVMYSRLFDWLVGRINASIGQDPKAFASIGLLDIYGFESFAFNDLEQFCINLANEKLQQHFNQHVFKWEQAEYEAEGIDWSYIEFVDNQDVLDLIEGRLGIVDQLDEQCRFPTATPRDFADKLFAASGVTSSSRFSRTKRSTSAFTLQHYAGPVSYSLDNFLDKNKDYVVAEHASLLSGATCDLLAALFAGSSGGEAGGSSVLASGGGGPLQNGRMPVAPSSGGGGAQLSGRSLKAFQFVSVCSHFKKQLAELMALLHQLEPHYVRCIKPNPGSRPLELDELYALHQLKCGGVMEAVRISCAGYPFRRTFNDFMRTYWQLHPAGRFAAEAGPQAGADACRTLLAGCGLAEGADYQVGHSKVFLKAHQAATLAQLHTAALAAAATRIQAGWRAGQAREAYRQARTAVILLQAAFRGLAARRLAEQLRREKAATALQSAWRSRQARVAYHQQQQAAIVLQALLRGLVARQAYAATLAAHRAAAATKLQAAWRGASARAAFKVQQQAALVLQSGWRGAAVRQQYRQLQQQHAAARSIQQAWRGHQHRQLQRRNAAARTIQQAWRRHKQPVGGFATYPGGLAAADAAARVIQGIWREREQHNSKVRRLQGVVRQYSSWTSAALVLQRAWRCRSARQALSKAQEAQRRAVFRQQMAAFEERARSCAGSGTTPTQQQQQQQQQQPHRRFFSDSDSLAPLQLSSNNPFSARSCSGAAAAAAAGPLAHPHVPGVLPPPQRAAYGVSFAGLPPAPGQQQRDLRAAGSSFTPSSPGAASSSSDQGVGGASSPHGRRTASPGGHRSSWVLPPPPPAAYGVCYAGINGDRHPLQPGRPLQTEAAAQPRASRSLKLFAPPPPAAYGVSYTGSQPGNDTTSSSSSSSSEPARRRTTGGGGASMCARLLEPAQPAAYGVTYSGLPGSGGSSSSLQSSRPRALWHSSSSGSSSTIGGGSSNSFSSSAATKSPKRSLLTSLKRLGSTKNGVSSGADGAEAPLLLLESDADAAAFYGLAGGEGGDDDDRLVKGDETAWLSAEERLSTRLGGLWDEKGKVASLLSTWKSRLSA